MQRGAAGEVPQGLQGCTFDARSDGVLPGSSTSAHCAYAVQYEFPWFPLLAGLSTSPEIKQSLAEVIAPLVKGGVQMARRWWLAYEMFHEALPLEGLEEARRCRLLRLRRRRRRRRRLDQERRRQVLQV